MAKRILVVDDNKEVADTKAKAIRKRGGAEFDVEALYGGRQCVDRIKQNPPIDLILLDLEMPEINGKDVLIELLRMKAPPPKVLITTAWGPTWIAHWEMQEMADTSEFKALVLPKIYDKGKSSSEMMEIIRGAM